MDCAIMQTARETDFLDIFRILRRRIGMIAAIASSMMAAAAIVILTLPKHYTAESAVVLNSRSSRIAELQSVLPKPLLGVPQADISVLRTEILTITSPTLVRMVVEEKHLADDPEFNPILAPARGRQNREGIAAWTRRQLSDLVSTLDTLFDIRNGEVRSGPDAGARRDDPLALTVQAVQKALCAGNDGISYVITICFRAREAERAAEIANAFATIYLREQENLKLATTRSAASWLGTRIKEMEGDLLRTEREHLTFQQQNSLGQENGTTLLDREISQASALLVTASAERAKIEAKVGEARRPNAIENAGPVLESPLIQKLRADEAGLQNTAAQLRLRFADQYPALQEAEARLREIRGKIRTEITRILTAQKNELNAARKTEADLRNALAELERKRAAMTGDALKLQEMERIANANRALYVSYLEKYKEISQQEHSEEPDARLLSAATPPLIPSSPNYLLLTGSAFAASTAFGVTASLLFGWLRRGVSNVEETERLGPVRGLGLIPESRNAALPLELLTVAPESSYPEAIHSINIALQCMEANPPATAEPSDLPALTQQSRVLLVTSALAAEGKSVFAASLARSLALSGKGTLLIDCDLRRPSVAHLFNDAAPREMSETLALSREIPDIAATDVATGLSYIAVRRERSSIPALLNAPPFQQLLTEARARYDYVVLDTPPLLGLSDALLLSRHADTTLLVVRWEHTPRAVVRNALKLLREHGVKLSGIVLTRVDMRKHARYNYGDSAYFHARNVHYHE